MSQVLCCCFFQKMHGKKHIKRCGVKEIISILSVQIKFLRLAEIIDEAWGKDVAHKPTNGTGCSSWFETHVV